MTQQMGPYHRPFRDRLLDPLFISRTSLRKSLEQVSGYARGRLLDVGCGGKPYLGCFPEVKAHFGLDLPANGEAPRNREAGGADVYGSGLALPFREGSFETVLCTQVLEHVPEPARLMGEVRRVLAPGGHLILTAPQVWGLHEVPHDYYRYTPYGLRHLAEQAGLEVMHLSQTTGAWATYGQRLSSEIFHRRGGSARRPVRVAVRLFCGAVINFSLLADRLYGHQGDTLDNVLVARKP